MFRSQARQATGQCLLEAAQSEGPEDETCKRSKQTYICAQNVSVVMQKVGVTNQWAVVAPLKVPRACSTHWYCLLGPIYRLHNYVTLRKIRMMPYLFAMAVFKSSWKHVGVTSGWVGVFLACKPHAWEQSSASSEMLQLAPHTTFRKEAEAAGRHPGKVEAQWLPSSSIFFSFP